MTGDVRGDIDEVLLTEASFGIGRPRSSLRQINRDAGCLTGQNLRGLPCQQHYRFSLERWLASRIQ
jgi:hypothetical protein